MSNNLLNNTTVINTEPKLLIISQNFPPELTASTVLVNNIFKYYPGNMHAIGGFVGGRMESNYPPPCPTDYLLPPANQLLKRGYYKLMPRLRFINKWLMLQIVKREKPSVIFGNYPEPEFFISSFEIAQKLRIPFYAYFHDLWFENMHRSFDVKQAKRWEKPIVENSARVICCSEFQQQYFKSKYGINTDLILHPVPDNEIQNLGYTPVPARKERIILFVGSLSDPMNTDALATLSHAIQLLSDEYVVHWYPIQDIPLSLLEKKGFDTSKIKIIVAPTAEMKRAITKADILFAPLSFKNCSTHEVRTVFSNKILSYLTAGRPMLVFSPPDSYHSIHAKKDGWGYVVEDDDRSKLAQAIQILCHDIPLQQQIVAGAIEEANKRCSSNQAAKLYQWVLNEK